MVKILLIIWFSGWRISKLVAFVKTSRDLSSLFTLFLDRPILSRQSCWKKEAKWRTGYTLQNWALNWNISASRGVLWAFGKTYFFLHCVIVRSGLHNDALDAELVNRYLLRLYWLLSDKSWSPSYWGDDLLGPSLQAEVVLSGCCHPGDNQCYYYRAVVPSIYGVFWKHSGLFQLLFLFFK